MADFQTLLATLTQVAIRARLHWDIWWFYEGNEERPKFLELLNKYSEFVRFDAHAHLTAHIVGCYQLYERKKSTRNLGVLVKRAAGEPGITIGALNAATALMTSAEPIAEKVRILRNNAFGHRSLVLGYDDAFLKAAVTPFQLRDLTGLALDTLNVFHEARGDAPWEFNDYPIGDVRRLFRKLRDFNGPAK